MARWRFSANLRGKVGKVVLLSLSSAEGYRGATTCHGNHLGNHLRFQAQTSWFPARKVVPGREEAGKLESGRWPTTRRLKKWERAMCAFFTPYAWRDQTCGTPVNMGLSWVGPLCARSQARSFGGVQDGERDSRNPLTRSPLGSPGAIASPPECLLGVAAVGRAWPVAAEG